MDAQSACLVTKIMYTLFVPCPYKTQLSPYVYETLTPLYLMQTLCLMKTKAMCKNARIRLVMYLFPNQTVPSIISNQSEECL